MYGVKSDYQLNDHQSKMLGRKSNPKLGNLSTLESSQKPPPQQAPQSLEVKLSLNDMNEFSDIPLSPLEEANKMVEKKLYQKAVDLYSKALLSCPGTDVDQFLEIYERRSALFFSMGQYTSSVDDCTFILKMTPSNTTVLTRRMHAYEKLGNIIAAISDKKKIQEHNKNARNAGKDGSTTSSSSAAAR